jgi:phosphate starvation-inducible PhoH-like protein
MPRKNSPKHPAQKSSQQKEFHLELLNAAQKMAWTAFQKHDVLFLTGPAGSGKSFLAVAFALRMFLSKEKSKIVLTRPIVESGESLGYLPGDFYEKVNPYMLPMFDCMDKLVGKEGPTRQKIIDSTEIAPLAFMRGRTFDDSVCILDEAQNCSMSQLKLFLTRFGEGSKVVITGDPTQSDLRGPVALAEVLEKLKGVPGIGMVEFTASSIVRHPLIGKILERLEEPVHHNEVLEPLQAMQYYPSIEEFEDRVD